jgi:Na+-transporting methylmalonyl-CoA/oxaloacetate decarboxylase gamma subunit
MTWGLGVVLFFMALMAVTPYFLSRAIDLHNELKKGDRR